VGGVRSSLLPAAEQDLVRKAETTPRGIRSHHSEEGFEGDEHEEKNRWRQHWASWRSTGGQDAKLRQSGCFVPPAVPPKRVVGAKELVLAVVKE
jgi:hypothetical protein